MSYLSVGALDAARQAYEDKVAGAITDAIVEIDQVLDNELSLTTCLARGLVFVPLALKARSTVQQARSDLSDRLLPAALDAIEDPSRDLGDIASAIDGFMQDTAAQIKNSIGIVLNDARFPGAGEIGAALFEVLSRMLDKAAQTAAKLPLAAQVVLGLVGVVAVAYVVRSFR